jgi:hypothetical protein
MKYCHPLKIKRLNLCGCEIYVDPRLVIHLWIEQHQQQETREKCFMTSFSSLQLLLLLQPPPPFVAATAFCAR